jgi:cytochrome c oxidase accessory protein FixG
MAEAQAARPTYTLYEARKKIHPVGVKGKFRSIKWALLWATLGVYYVLPFVRWGRGPHEPSQAVLIDLAHGRFYFFFVELWPQEVYYIMGLLILAAFTLFLMNAVAGRVWCGYLCPQTVWTDLFMWVERLLEGDRRDRKKLDAAPWTAEKVATRATKHFLWLMIAWWTGGAWVLYFADAPTLVVQLATFQAPVLAYAWIGILTCTTYLLAGHMREQVCSYMCPWPRIQGALTDQQSLNIIYRYDRGEPRGSAKKNALLRSEGKPAGDCVDCFQCVAACPAGIDIRSGLQMECIQCGLCADACDAVMLKVGRPPGLIAYDTELNIMRRHRGDAPVYKLLRPRTVLYGVLILGVAAAMLTALATRSFTSVSALHDRNPIFVTLADGSIRNGYTLRVLNKRPVQRVFALELDGLPGARVEVVGAPPQDGRTSIAVAPDATHELRALVFAPAPARLEKSTPVTFRIVDLASGESAAVQDLFKAP